MWYVCTGPSDVHTNIYSTESSIIHDSLRNSTHDWRFTLSSIVHELHSLIANVITKSPTECMGKLQFVISEVFEPIQHTMHEKIRLQKNQSHHSNSKTTTSSINSPSSSVQFATISFESSLVITISLLFHPQRYECAEVWVHLCKSCVWKRGYVQGGQQNKHVVIWAFQTQTSSYGAPPCSNSLDSKLNVPSYVVMPSTAKTIVNWNRDWHISIPHRSRLDLQEIQQWMYSTKTSTWFRYVMLYVSSSCGCVTLTLPPPILSWCPLPTYVRAYIWTS